MNGSSSHKRRYKNNIRIIMLALNPPRRARRDLSCEEHLYSSQLSSVPSGMWHILAKPISPPRLFRGRSILVPIHGFWEIEAVHIIGIPTGESGKDEKLELCPLCSSAIILPRKLNSAPSPVPMKGFRTYTSCSRLFPCLIYT